MNPDNPRPNPKKFSVFSPGQAPSPQISENLALIEARLQIHGLYVVHIFLEIGPYIHIYACIKI